MNDKIFQCFWIMCGTFYAGPRDRSDLCPTCREHPEAVRGMQRAALLRAVEDLEFALGHKPDRLRSLSVEDRYRRATYCAETRLSGAHTTDIGMRPGGPAYVALDAKLQTVLASAR